MPQRVNLDEFDQPECQRDEYLDTLNSVVDAAL